MHNLCRQVQNKTDEQDGNTDKQYEQKNEERRNNKIKHGRFSFRKLVTILIGRKNAFCYRIKKEERNISFSLLDLISVFDKPCDTRSHSVRLIIALISLLPNVTRQSSCYFFFACFSRSGHKLLYCRRWEFIKGSSAAKILQRKIDDADHFAKNLCFGVPSGHDGSFSNKHHVIRSHALHDQAIHKLMEMFIDFIELHAMSPLLKLA